MSPAVHFMARSSQPQTWDDGPVADDAPQQLPPVDSTALLGPAVIEAAVGALAQRNQHHIEQMDEAEREQAVETWRGIAGDVLAAAHNALFSGEPQPNRAVLVFEDGGTEEIAVHASFTPQLQDMGEGQVAGSPAQITALTLLEGLQNQGEEQEP
jgi:hypothetical protein